jgi:hypothetical protein
MRTRAFAAGGAVAMLASACLCIAPGIAVAKKEAKVKAAYSQAEQDFWIRRATRTNNKQQRQIRSVTNRLGDAVETLTEVDGRLAGIEALAPVIASALTALQQGLTTVGSGLSQLNQAYQSVEFGATRMFIGPGGAGGAVPFTAVSPDIPDDGNRATASGEVPVPVGPNANAGQIPENVLLSPRSAIRSAESDGAATGDPAGYVGAIIFVTCGGGPAAGAACDADPGAGSVPVPTGAVLCVLGPTPNQNINIPGQGTQPVGVVTIQEKTTRTDQLKPDANSPNPVAGGPTSGPLSTPDGCLTGETGNTLLVNVQSQFVDIPTSTTPGPTE